MHDITLESITNMMNDMGFTTIVQLRDIISSDREGRPVDLTAIYSWFNIKGYRNGIDYLMDTLEEVNLGQLQMVPVFGFRNAGDATYFKLAFR